MTSDNTASNQPSPSAQMQEILGGYQRSQLVHVAAKLGIADLLKDGSKTSEELAQATEADPTTLYRVLRGLAGMGVFTESEGQRFQLTPLSELLRTDAPGTMYYAAKLIGEVYWNSWGSLSEGVMNGTNASAIAHGVSHYEYLQQHPEIHESFNKQMVMLGASTIAPILEAYDFSGITRLVDVGGGHGHLILAILRANPEMEGVLFDLPPVIEEAKAEIEAQGLVNRCQLVGGSFLDSIPQGDACVVKSVIQTTNDNDAATILKNCRGSVGPDGKVIVIDRILRGGPDAMMDINLMIGPGGKVRTEEELRGLHKEAGLNLVRIIPTATQFYVLESVPV